jgi:hypothetical protein
MSAPAQPQVQANTANRGETQNRDDRGGDIRSTNIAAAKGNFDQIMKNRIGGSSQKFLGTKRNGQNDPFRQGRNFDYQ